MMKNGCQLILKVMIDGIVEKFTIMKRRVIDVGYGKETLYEIFRSSEMSSRLLYGLAQLDDVYDIKRVSLKISSFVGTLKNNIKVLQSCDVIFMSYFYRQPLFLLALLRKIGFFRKRRIVVISHLTLPSGGNYMERIILRCVYSTVNTFLFHSQKNLDESVEQGLVSREHSELLYWGDDLDYIDKHLKSSPGNFFLSTGCEQRDFPLLISAFSKTGSVLELYSNSVNYETDYSYLTEFKEKYINVKINIVEKGTETTRILAQRASECMCVVIPLIQEKIHYCVGLTSLVEAMALGKPIISTCNPYSPVDIEKEGVGLVADDEASWIFAINYIATHPEEAKQMGQRARKLAEDKFNIKSCARQIDRLFSD